MNQQAMDSSQKAQDMGVPTPSPSSSARPATRPYLLPAFEPIPSSPSLPRPAKRKLSDSPCSRKEELKHYPTPVPTSSTGILPSSPSRRPLTRPGLQRTLSTLSERVPLGTLPSVDLPANGEPVLMGRSSNSSHYQLSTNRQISRVHVRASFRVPNEQHERGQVFIECLGWNGARIHCRGKTWNLEKGHTFSSDRPSAEIMLDVQDARVFVQWPALHRTGSISSFSDATWEDPDSPKRNVTPTIDHFGSSPPQALIHLQSPVSPLPRARNFLNGSSTFIGRPLSSPNDLPSVLVYEDNASGDESVSLGQSAEPSSVVKAEPDSNTSILKASQSSFLSSSPLSDPDDFSDRDEENDPIVHSFGPYGENLLPRMATMNAPTPEQRHRLPLKSSISPQQTKCASTSNTKNVLDKSPVRNHIINQLAFSRLHSLPLSTILKNLPSSMKGEEKEENQVEEAKQQLYEDDLKRLLDNIACVGEIAREGKDAAGKPLEDEFYYVPEMDTDTMRRSTVEQGLGKPGLRNVRKQHKQYYWKRPRC